MEEGIKPTHPSLKVLSARAGWMNQFLLAIAFPTYAQDKRQPGRSIALWFAGRIISARSSCSAADRHLSVPLSAQIRFPQPKNLQVRAMRPSHAPDREPSRV